jgi:hypothetical protein
LVLNTSEFDRALNQLGQSVNFGTSDPNNGLNPVELPKTEDLAKVAMENPQMRNQILSEVMDYSSRSPPRSSRTPRGLNSSRLNPKLKTLLDKRK